MNGHKNEPRGIDLLAVLIELLADQEGVKITYDLKEIETNGNRDTRRNINKQQILD